MIFGGEFIDEVSSIVAKSAVSLISGSMKSKDLTKIGSIISSLDMIDEVSSHISGP